MSKRYNKWQKWVGYLLLVFVCMITHSVQINALGGEPDQWQPASGSGAGWLVISAANGRGDFYSPQSTSYMYVPTTSSAGAVGVYPDTNNNNGYFVDTVRVYRATYDTNTKITSCVLPSLGNITKPPKTGSVITFDNSVPTTKTLVVGSVTYNVYCITAATSAPVNIFFKLQASIFDSSFIGVYASTPESGGTGFANVDQYGSPPAWNLTIPYGLDSGPNCDQHGDGVLGFYDMDVDPGYPQNANMRIRVRKVDKNNPANSTYVDLQGDVHQVDAVNKYYSFYQNSELGDTRTYVWSATLGKWVSTGPPEDNVIDITEDSNPNNASNTFDRPIWKVTLTDGYDIGYKYILEVTQIGPKNKIKVTLPYDQASYLRTCSPANLPAVTCTLSAPGVIQVGESYTPSAIITHSGPPGAPDVTNTSVNFVIDNPATWTGNYGPVTLSNGQTINPASSSGSYSNSSPGSHTVTATLTGSGINSVSCGSQALNIALYPYLKVYGGDVSAGGAFQGSSGTCSSPNINATINAYAGVVGSEYIGSSAQFGITALMNINGFYSAGTRPSLSPRPPIGLTFSNATGVGDTTYGGAFGGTGNCITDYYNNTQDPDIQTAASFPPTSSPVVTTYGSNNAPTMADIRWSSSGTIAGWNCVNMNEGSAPAAYTWSNNYVCTPNGIGLRWSSAGVIAGMYCVQINEPSEPAAYTWTDNYLCTPTDIGLRWSSAGAIAGMTCTQFNEPSDPYTWTDNYLCEPADITASSTYPDLFGSNFAAANANDAPATNDWASNGQGAGAWMQYNWTTPTKVAKVTIRDRTNPTDNIAGLTLSFSDGSSVSFGALPSDGTPQDIAFPERTVTWMRMTVTSVSAGTLNVGVTEMSTHAVASTSGGIAGFAAGRTQYVLSVGDKSLGSLIIPAGSQVAVYVAGDLYLTGDITYDTASRATTKDIPYMAFIVKGNIYVSPSVSRLDGLYIAQPNNPATPTDGRIYTCAPPQGSSPKYYSLSNLYDNCNGKQLVVNGALVAQQIKFMRTINTLNQATANEIPNFADGSNTKAGEVINYTPEMYLAPSPLKDPNSPSSSSRVQPYDAIFSLPPVF